MPLTFNRLRGVSLVSIASIAFAAACAHADVDLARVENDLKGPGAIGLIHGRAAYPSNSPQTAGVEYTVVTFRDPGDFFSHYEAPMIGATDAVSAALRALGRHDQIRIRGEFISNGAPVRHIRVDAFDLIKKYESGEPPRPSYEYQVRIPDELVNVPSFVGKVHAVAEGGKILVVEYKDAVLPLFPRSPDLTRDLFRGDTVRIYHKIRATPEAPTHLMFDPEANPPIVMLQKLSDLNGKPAQLSGVMAKFPQSPQISFDVYALISTNEFGVAHDFTLANLENPDVFQAVRQKLEAAWNAHAATAVQGRNQLLNYQLRVTARGTYNVVDPGQANPQILLNSADDVSVEFLP